MNRSLESSLRSASAHLDSLNERRETLIKDSRDVISMCSKIIIQVHNFHLREAKSSWAQAGKKLRELRKIAESDLARYIIVPEQEYVEASVMLSLAERGEIPDMETTHVSPSSYILGLLDSIGEIKREVYDDIRKNNLERAETRFACMENLYVLLSPFAVYDHVVHGVRRKLDVARILIEETRSTITEENRRSAFMQSIEKLSTKLGLQTEREVRGP